MAKEGHGLEITELRLGLPGDNGHKVSEKTKEMKKRVFSEILGDNDNGDMEAGEDGKISPATKSQVVGWPPVCSYRRKNSCKEISKIYVKVSMDGVPFLRKIDLGVHKGYDDLAMGLEKLFGCFGIGEALKGAEKCEFVPIYEDKDGDWMLAGDVPWQMFMESCKRLRIMKRSDATGFGLQPRGSLMGTSKDE